MQDNTMKQYSALMIIFGPKREEVRGGWRKLHNEELHNLCCSLNIKDEMGRARSMHRKMRKAYKISVKNLKERDKLGVISLDSKIS